MRSAAVCLVKDVCERVGVAHCTICSWEGAPAEKVKVRVALIPAAVVAE